MNIVFNRRSDRGIPPRRAYHHLCNDPPPDNIQTISKCHYRNDRLNISYSALVWQLDIPKLAINWILRRGLCRCGVWRMAGGGVWVFRY